METLKAYVKRFVLRQAGATSSLQKDGVPTITMTKKTHGFLPLFVSQFFLLLATVGAGYAIFVLPQSRLKEVQDVRPLTLSTLLLVHRE